jgi:flagellar biosynthesis protein FlhF
MKLKTYVARNPQEALAQVRKELGPEAVILSTQSHTYATPGSSLADRRRVEVTAAANQSLALDALNDFQPWSPESVLSGSSFQDLREDLEEMKALIRQWLGEYGPPSWLTPHQELTMLFHALTQAGVHDHILRRWLAQLRPLLTEGTTKNLKEWSLRHLMQSVAVVDPWKLAIKGARTWVFGGATGVGKTTTIAKIAIQAAFMRKMRVGLISLDTARLGGQDLLAAYARVSELPLVAAQSRSELVNAMEKMTNLDLILIDTPGRNPRDPRLAPELRQFFGEVPKLEHHLVVSATTSESNLADAFQGFGIMPLTSCILTKVDEGRDIVGAFNQLCQRGVAISYVTTGQKVPEDLELANHRMLSRLLLKTHHRPKMQR